MVWWGPLPLLTHALAQRSALAWGVASQAFWPGEVNNRLRLQALQKSMQDDASNLLRAHDWVAALGTDAPLHTLQGVFVQRWPGRVPRQLLVYVSSGAAAHSDCHACAPVASFFEFEQSDVPGWRLARSAVAGVQLGAWGRLAPLHVLDLVPGQVGVFFMVSDGAQGHDSDELRGFGWVRGQWQEVLSEVVGDSVVDETGHVLSWQAAWALERPPVGGLRIRLDANGVETPGQGAAPVLQMQFDGERFK
jgi:hypothetical protein